MTTDTGLQWVASNSALLLCSGISVTYPTDSTRGPCVNMSTVHNRIIQPTESVATLPPFSPIEGQKWFDQISSQ
jgi:hypothetical protein